MVCLGVLVCWSFVSWGWWCGVRRGKSAARTGGGLRVGSAGSCPVRVASGRGRFFPAQDSKGPCGVAVLSLGCGGAAQQRGEGKGGAAGSCGQRAERARPLDCQLFGASPHPLQRTCRAAPPCRRRPWSPRAAALARRRRRPPAAAAAPPPPPRRRPRRARARQGAAPWFGEGFEKRGEVPAWRGAAATISTRARARVGVKGAGDLGCRANARTRAAGSPKAGASRFAARLPCVSVFCSFGRIERFGVRAGGRCEAAKIECLVCVFLRSLTRLPSLDPVA